MCIQYFFSSTGSTFLSSSLFISFFLFYKFMPERMTFRSLSFLLQIVVDSHCDIFSSKQQTEDKQHRNHSHVFGIHTERKRRVCVMSRVWGHMRVQSAWLYDFNFIEMKSLTCCCPIGFISFIHIQYYCCCHWFPIAHSSISILFVVVLVLVSILVQSVHFTVGDSWVGDNKIALERLCQKERFLKK